MYYENGAFLTPLKLTPQENADILYPGNEKRWHKWFLCLAGHPAYSKLERRPKKTVV